MKYFRVDCVSSLICDCIKVTHFKKEILRYKLLFEICKQFFFVDQFRYIVLSKINDKIRNIMECLFLVKELFFFVNKTINVT